MRLVEAGSVANRRGARRAVARQQRDASDALAAEATNDLTAVLAQTIGQTDHAERLTAVAHEHGRAAARLDFLDARVQRRRAELPFLEQTMAADDGGRRGHGRLGAESGQRAEPFAGRDGETGGERAVNDRAADRMLGPRLERGGHRQHAVRSSAPSTPRTSPDRHLRVGQRAGLVERDARDRRQDARDARRP